MKVQIWKRCLALLVVVAVAAPASAMLPFSVQWKAKYSDNSKDENFVKAVKEANCNVCHDPNTKSKKDHNEYGKVVKKYIKKAEYEKIKGDMDAAKKYIQEGLDKAAAEKAPDGKTYGERIKEGKLPAG
jgi:cytochrome c553